MVIHSARWVCPISGPPLRDGWVAVRAGRIDAVGAGETPKPQGRIRDHGAAAIIPALVNAHTHLELSWLRGRVPPAATFTEWITQLFLARGGRRESPDDPMVVAAAAQAAREARAFGTIAVGDISNSLASISGILDAGLFGLVFHELLGFNLPHGRAVEETRPRRTRARELCNHAVRVSIAPHAPYSVSPEMFRAIRSEVDASDVRITSVHVGESASEIDFLRDGSGPWPQILRWVGSTREDWSPPGCDPVTYLDGLGMLDDRTLVVHGVQLTDAALARLAAIGCTLVTCPRSNQWVGAGAPPVARFYASGVDVAIGTDSLTSVDDLNLFAELKAMRWLAPGVPARRLLESATLTGARALGVGDELGSIEPGKRAALLAIALDGAAAASPTRSLEGAAAAAPEAVEEYLLSGIDARQVTWIA
jgi:cytosine/adenosine deaminase-related metal-dependent hydrolase